MAAHVFRLRLALLVGAFRGSPGRTAGRLLGLAALAAAAGLLAGRVAAIGDLPPQTAATTLVLVSAGVALASALTPLLLGVDDPIDPRRFRTTGAEPLTVAASHLLASLASASTWFVVVFEVAAARAWTASGASAGAVVAGAVLHGAVCVLLARVAMAVRAAAGAEGGSPDIARVLVAALVLASIPATVLLAGSADGVTRDALRSAATALSLTPLAAGAALPAAAEGLLASGAAWAVGLATLVVLACAWWLLVRRLLTTVEHPVVAHGGAGLGWFGLVPPTAGGAVAARSLVYGLRDSRYIANVAVIPVAGVLPVIPLMVAGVPLEVAALIPIPFMALLYGWLPHNDLAYDSSALWLHIATGVRGASDRVGRLAPVTLVAVPVLIVGTPLALAVSGRADALPALAGCAASLLLSGFGLSSIASVLAPYPVARPGDGPFKQPQRTGTAGIWAQALVLLGAVAVSAPVLWLAWRALVDGVADPVVLWAGLGTGIAVLLVGIGIGAAVFDRRGTRLMEFAGAS